MIFRNKLDLFWTITLLVYCQFLCFLAIYAQNYESLYQLKAKLLELSNQYRPVVGACPKCQRSSCLRSENVPNNLEFRKTHKPGSAD